MAKIASASPWRSGHRQRLLLCCCCCCCDDIAAAAAAGMGMEHRSNSSRSGSRRTSLEIFFSVFVVGSMNVAS